MWTVSFPLIVGLAAVALAFTVVFGMLALIVLRHLLARWCEH